MSVSLPFLRSKRGWKCQACSGIVPFVRAIRSSLAIYWLVAAAVLFAAVGGPDHLHLCLDGQEQRLALHGPDGELHHYNHGSTASNGHFDEDVELPETGLAKSFAKSFLQPALLLAVVWILPSPAVHSFNPVRSLTVPFSLNSRDLLPPLRGPPAINLH